MRNIVSLKELRLKMDKYIKATEKGESFTVVKQSKPVFNIIPVEEEDRWETVIDFRKIDKEGVPIDHVIRALELSLNERPQKGG